jgi:hypothetical protein
MRRNPAQSCYSFTTRTLTRLNCRLRRGDFRDTPFHRYGPNHPFSPVPRAPSNRYASAFNLALVGTSLFPVLRPLCCTPKHPNSCMWRSCYFRLSLNKYRRYAVLTMTLPACRNLPRPHSLDRFAESTVRCPIVSSPMATGYTTRHFTVSPPHIHLHISPS